MSFEGPHVTDFVNSLANFDTVLMGKNTYKWGYTYGLQPGQPAYPGLMHYIFSNSMERFEHERLQVIKDDAVPFIRQLKDQPGRSIWLCGGALLAGSLLDAGLLDGLIVKLYPVGFGDGMPLFGGSKREFDLSLISTNTYVNGTVLLNYTIEVK